MSEIKCINLHLNETALYVKINFFTPQTDSGEIILIIMQTILYQCGAKVQRLTNIQSLVCDWYE
jgi:hypothetical protein